MSVWQCGNSWVTKNEQILLIPLEKEEKFFIYLLSKHRVLSILKTFANPDTRIPFSLEEEILFYFFYVCRTMWKQLSYKNWTNSSYSSRRRRKILLLHPFKTQCVVYFENLCTPRHKNSFLLGRRNIILLLLCL